MSSSLAEVRKTLIERGVAKYGDTVWTTWDWNAVDDAVREELADAAVWAWLLWTRADGYDSRSRPLVRLGALRARDLIRRGWDLASAPLAPWAVPGEVVAPCAAQTLTGEFWREWPCEDLKPPARAAGFPAAVESRVAFGRRKYADQSFGTPGQILAAELVEELVSASLWTEIAWRRLLQDPRAEGSPPDPAPVVALVELLDTAALLLLAVAAVAADAERVRPLAPSVASIAPVYWLSLSARRVG